MKEISQVSPYYGETFFSFFWVLARRLFFFMTGQLSWQEIAPDEIQMIVLVLIALSASLVGVFIVLRKASMLANSLSHTILFGIVLAFFLLLPFRGASAQGEAGSLDLTTLLMAAFLAALCTTFITEFLIGSIGLPPDASIGFVFTTLFALGIILVTTMTRNAHIGTEAIMGNVDALQKEDILFVFFLFLANAFIVCLFFKEYTLTTFDASYAQALGFSSFFFSYLLMGQVAFTVVAGFRAVGVLMILAFLTAPILTARLFAHRVGSVMGYSILFGCLPSFAGVALARHLYSFWGLPVSTGGLVVTLLAIQFFLCLFGVSLWRSGIGRAFRKARNP